MKQSTSGWAAVVLFLAAAWPLAASAIEFSGTRSNISPGGTPGGRCGPAITVSFAPDAFAASGTSNLGAFSYTASHCIASPPPGPYTDGEFVWDFGNGTLTGTYVGLLTDGGAPGSFHVSETISFTGGTGAFAGTTGMASATGTLVFGMLEGEFASFSDVSFEGSLTPVPEPATWALMLGGVAGVVGAWKRRRATA